MLKLHRHVLSDIVLDMVKECLYSGNTMGIGARFNLTLTILVLPFILG